MSKIQVMSENLANKIAAGEVVEKTMNVVKELVENAIDAGSSEIEVILKDSGVKEITVIDNGIGMDRDDAVLAFSRHATSKLKSVDDLFNISSLGFRGEALPSIASISNIRLKTSDGKVGTLLTMSGGNDLKVSSCDLQKGTSITVTDLFYNTPVRLKYLKNLYTELSNIVEYLDKMALAHSDIKFTLYNNDKCLLKTDGSGDLLKVIYSIYGRNITKKMIPISGENDDYYVSGYISFPEVTKSNKSSINTLVNGRVIKNNELNRIISDCYHTYVHKGRYPVVVINIDVDPILIDINIHPTKMDIKFSKLDELTKLLKGLIDDRLKTLTLIPDANTREVSSFNEVYSQISHDIDDDEDEDIITEKMDKQYEEFTLDFSVQEESLNIDDSIADDLPFEVDAEPRIKKMNVIGNIFMTYIICSNEDGMYLVDQHAAAERINYEKFLDKLTNSNNTIIDLLTPIRIEVSNVNFIKIREHLDVLKEIGIDTEEFGSNTFIVRSHPAWIGEDIANREINNIFELIAKEGTFSKEKFIDTAVMSITCHSSVKAHDYISIEDMQWIVDNIRYCKNPFTCPHGRPTIITYTKDDIDKMFKRDYNE